MWRVIGWMKPDASKGCGAFIFKSRQCSRCLALCAWWWKHNNPLKCQEPLTWQSVTCQTTWILIHTAVRTQNITVLIIFADFLYHVAVGCIANILEELAASICWVKVVGREGARAIWYPDQVSQLISPITLVPETTYIALSLPTHFNHAYGGRRFLWKINNTSYCHMVQKPHNRINLNNGHANIKLVNNFKWLLWMIMMMSTTTMTMMMTTITVSYKFLTMA